ncbi:leucyl/phenylalanyl-tRNA--protein transferase [Austwickia chelonae]|uniref:Leucyl/phenylalanyl-tRNA--protein transferase n=1 Tax=Austwickia chelonae NBRC 105200 TaxID=1184607 RepID=K6ULY4_9MICO|nr:leucyl/phenylalanyl-tRNA--protein transferase [Austwickia chelonae]GAB77646.1 leucyl/phenylalanyl-tRNA--protein transferase [Austwickia chelonae NBRC 105200]SEW14855.1 leucyl/phenylalanyl-tRNA--protein transferase [Austwickia chelonae]
MPPVEPPPTPWDLASARPTPGDDLVAVGADLEAGTILQAYRNGLFPMGLGDDGEEPMGWWSPDPRGVLEPSALKVSRSLSRSLRKFDLTWDAAFDRVVEECADPTRPGFWITPQIRAAYGDLHELGWAHSVEVWSHDELVGGLYGVAVGGLFAGESMFHRATDASKAALVGLVEVIRADADPRRIIDVQWHTEHLGSLGVQEFSRTDYLARLHRALSAPHLTLARGSRITVHNDRTGSIHR